MLLTFHTPEGVFQVDTETVTDGELTQIGMTRARLQEVMEWAPRDFTAELDNLKARVEKLEKK